LVSAVAQVIYRIKARGWVSTNQYLPWAATMSTRLKDPTMRMMLIRVMRSGIS